MSKRKPYVRQMPKNWWLQEMFYTKYIIREGSSLVVAAYSFILLWGLLRLTQGAEAFTGWVDAMSHPVAIVFHLITLVWTLYHAVTWFALAPAAANVWIKDKRVSDIAIISSLYAALIIVSLIALVIVI